MEKSGERRPVLSQSAAQQSAERIRLLRQELATEELQQVLGLSPEQQARFDDWARTRLTQLAQEFDVDTTVSQQRASWGMRIASTLGAFALCAALVLFFMRYWGNLETYLQVAIVFIVPLLALGCAEFAAARERTLYFTGLLAIVAFAAFVLNLAVLGSIFNITSTERALLAWGAFATVVAYRYGLRLLLAAGLLLLISYGAATVTAQSGYRWFDFGERPELIALLAVLVFCAPLVIRHYRHTDFPAVYRLIGAVVFFLCVLSLAEWGVSSYLPLSQHDVERLYELLGLLTSAAAIWLGIRQHWNGLVNTSAAAFVIFLFSRLYHWWWDWMPKYLFFAIIGGLGIALVLILKRLRGQMAPKGAHA
ncbi:MAG: DUF2157 domain-containing protein [Bryobacteraceae bacterium]